MLTKVSSRQGYFATHIVGMFNMSSILKKQNTFLKPEYHDFVKDKIIRSIF